MAKKEEEKKKRSLEDYLFSTPPAREDYVTAPEYTSEVTPEGKTVTKSKTAKMEYDPATKSAVVEGAPIEVGGDLREEAQAPRPLKQRILPPEEPMGPPPAMAPEYVAPAPKAPEAKKEVEPSKGMSGWERFLVGATPALVGLLTGNELEGMQLSGDTLVNNEMDLYKREKDFNQKIAEMKAKRDLASYSGKGTNYARQELYDPSTKKTYVHSIVNGQRAGVLGEAAPKGAGKENWVRTELYNPETRRVEVAMINPQNKDVEFYGPGKETSKKVLTELDFNGEPTRAIVDLDADKVTSYLGKIPEKKSPYSNMEEGRNKRFADQKLLDLTKEFTKPTSNFNKMKENLDGIVMAAKQLNLGNPRANAGLQNYLARNIYGEKGPLSDQDLARLAGDPSYGAIIERFLDARLNGQLGALDRQDIRQILDLAYKVQTAKMNGEASRFGKAFATLGYDPTPGIQAYIKGSIQELPEFRSGNITRMREEPAAPSKGTVKNGYKFLGGDPAKKENWEKQ